MVDVCGKVLSLSLGFRGVEPLQVEDENQWLDVTSLVSKFRRVSLGERKEKLQLRVIVCGRTVGG